MSAWDYVFVALSVAAWVWVILAFPRRLRSMESWRHPPQIGVLRCCVVALALGLVLLCCYRDAWSAVDVFYHAAAWLSALTALVLVEVVARRKRQIDRERRDSEGP